MSAFCSILDCGAPEVPGSEKARLMDDIGRVLLAAGCNPQLAADACAVLQPLRHLLLQVWARKVTPADAARPEGRTCYHPVVIESKPAIVAVKGMGSQHAFLEQGGPFPGFPALPGTLFFDYATHPRRRIWGTETLRWGTLELASCAVIFSLMARSEGWNAISQAVNAGVSIPLGRAELMELSGHLRALFERTTGTIDWPGHREPFVTVGHVVPDYRRMLRPSQVTEAAPELRPVLARELVSVENARTQARTLRRLLDVGVTYSWVSSHGQNLYQSGLVANADYSDSAFLSDYGDETERISLVYAMLSRHDGMTPLPYPMESLAIAPEQVEDCHREFWPVLMAGAASPKAIALIPSLYPFLPEQISIAAALLLATHCRGPLWQEASGRRRELVSALDPVGRAADELQYKIRSNLDADRVRLCAEALQESDPAGVLAVARFLSTGVLEPMEASAVLAPLLRLRNVSGKLAETARARLLEAIGRIQTNPERAEKAHLQFAASLLEDGAIDNGLNVLECLAMLTSGRFATLAPAGGEQRGHYYSRLLLSGEDLDGWVREIRLLETLASWASRDRMAPPSARAGRDISEYCWRRSIPDTYDVLLRVLPCGASNRALQLAIPEFYRRYNDIVGTFAARETEYTDRRGVLSDTATALDELAREYEWIPELAMFHAFCMLDPFEPFDSQRCRNYYGEVLNYYRLNFEDRCRELGYDTAAAWPPGL